MIDVAHNATSIRVDIKLTASIQVVYTDINRYEARTAGFAYFCNNIIDVVGNYSDHCAIQKGFDVMI